MRILYLGVVVGCALLMLGGLTGYHQHLHRPNDFYAFRSFARFVRLHAPALVYDQKLLADFQHLPQGGVFAFMYPPGMLLLVAPLASLPYDPGYVGWVGIGLAASIATLVSRGAWAEAVLMLVAPSTLWTALCGQSSLLVTALLTGGLLLSPRRPWLAGILLGLATYKPQLGILVPVALLAAGQWRTIVAATATFLLIVAASSAAFGADIWIVWAHSLGSIVDVRSKHAADWAKMLATLSSDFAMLGVPRRIADLGQAAGFVAMAAWIWRCFAHAPGGADPGRTQLLRVAALAAATFLATPFAFIYDLPLFTMAVALFIHERRQSADPFEFGEIFAILAALLAPAMFLFDRMHVFGTVAILAMLVAIARRLRRVAHPAAAPLPVGITA